MGAATTMARCAKAELPCPEAVRNVPPAEVKPHVRRRSAECVAPAALTVNRAIDDQPAVSSVCVYSRGRRIEGAEWAVPALRDRPPGTADEKRGHDENQADDCEPAVVWLASQQQDRDKPERSQNKPRIRRGDEPQCKRQQERRERCEEEPLVRPGSEHAYRRERNEREGEEEVGIDKRCGPTIPEPRPRKRGQRPGSCAALEPKRGSNHSRCRQHRLGTRQSTGNAP